MPKSLSAAFSALVALSLSTSGGAQNPPSAKEATAITEDAYIYGFPMIVAYKALYEFNVDKSSGQYKVPFNQIWNDSHVFTPKDTAVTTPNSDTPYSLVQADLRAEPLVLCVPEVEKGRYYAVQLSDMYSFNYGYIGSRTTGNGPGCYMVAGPNWKSETRAGIKKTFHSETQFSLVIYRTQLFDAADIDNVKKVQAGYEVQTLSAYLGKPAPPAAPVINSPMLPAMKKNPDGSLTMYIQKDAPAKADEPNWLPAPNGPIFLVMRLYWPKETPPSILPPGEGSWKPPPVVRVK